MDILHTVLCTSTKLLTRKICLTNYNLFIQLLAIISCILATLMRDSQK